MPALGLAEIKIAAIKTEDGGDITAGRLVDGREQVIKSVENDGLFANIPEYW